MDIHVSRRGFLNALWQPAGVIYLCFCLAGLAAGLWHGRIVPQLYPTGEVSMPMLQALAVAQVFFFLLVYPLILFRRKGQIVSRNPKPGTRNPDGSSRNTNSEFRNTVVALLLEFAGMLIATLPFYILAAWFSDAAGRDVLRAVLAVAAVWPLSVLAGRMLSTPARRNGMLIRLLIIAFGLPGAWYICSDFLRLSCGWLLKLSPMVFAWTSAGARQANWLPQPIWAWLFWPILTAAGAVFLWILPAPKPQHKKTGVAE